MVVPLIALAIPSVLIGASRSGRCCSAASSATPSSFSAKNDVLPRSARAWATGRSVRAARAARTPPFWIWRWPGCSRPGSLYLQAAAPAGPDRREAQPLRCGARATSTTSTGSTRTSGARRAPVWARSAGAAVTRRSSTAAGERLGAARIGLPRGRRAARAERLSLFLCLLDGHRPGGAARLVPGRAPELACHDQKIECMMSGSALASDLAAHRRRPGRAVARRPRDRARLAGWRSPPRW